VQEALHCVHAHQDEEGNREEGKEQQEHSNRIHSDFHFSCEGLLLKGLLEENTGKLGMGKRKSPKTKVRGSVGDCTEDELNSFDQLMNEQLGEGVLLFGLPFVSYSLRNLLDVLVSAIVYHLSFWTVFTDFLLGDLRVRC